MARPPRRGSRCRLSGIQPAPRRDRNRDRGAVFSSGSGRTRPAHRAMAVARLGGFQIGSPKRLRGSGPEVRSGPLQETLGPGGFANGRRTVNRRHRTCAGYRRGNGCVSNDPQRGGQIAWPLHPGTAKSLQGLGPVMSYPKRLIEVDLPIKRISAHSRREKSIRHGHISTLHIWWARRPLAACRAVICASLWPDPADENCPQAFRDAAARLISQFAEKVYNTTSLHATASKESFGQWEGIVAAKAKGINLDPNDPAHLNKLRFALLDFIADFANWDNSTVREYLDTSRALTQAAHEALGGAPGTRPLVVDPFAGGGSIPLEALRVGADAFASDLNPVPVLLNKVLLEYIPKYGQRLADEIRRWGAWVKESAEKELAGFYPTAQDGATPIAYLWARTIRCEGPGCGAEVPLIRSLWLAKKDNRCVALQLQPRPSAKRVDFQIVVKDRDGWVDQADPQVTIEHPKFDGMVKRGSATCPCCGYTTPVARVREQLKARQGGANDAQLMCVVSTMANQQGRIYRLPTDRDLKAVNSR